MPTPFRAALATSIWLAGALVTPAAADDGWYAAVHGGLAAQSDQTLSLSGLGPRQPADLTLDNGFLSGASVGYGFAGGWRLEGEFSYQTVDAEDPGFAAPAPTGDGDYASTAFALNALYEFDLLGSPKARTYIGAGYVRLTEVDLDLGERSNFSGSGNGWQVLLGARYDVGQNGFLDAGLRYLSATGLTLERETGPGGIEADYQPWGVSLAFGRRF